MMVLSARRLGKIRSHEMMQAELRVGFILVLEGTGALWSGMASSMLLATCSHRGAWSQRLIDGFSITVLDLSSHFYFQLMGNGIRFLLLGLNLQQSLDLTQQLSGFGPAEQFA